MAFLALASADEGRERFYNKRSPVGYSSPTSRPGFASGGASSSGVTYTKSALGGSGQKSFTPSQLHYASQPSDNTESSAPVTFGNSQQQYDFQAPAFGKVNNEIWRNVVSSKKFIFYEIFFLFKIIHFWFFSNVLTKNSYFYQSLSNEKQSFYFGFFYFCLFNRNVIFQNISFTKPLFHFKTINLAVTVCVKIETK